MTTLWLDYETRSEADLLKVGAYNYANHRSTQILIASYAIDDGPVKRWEAWRGKRMPGDLLKALHSKSVTVKAHNATFERLITYHCLGIDVPEHRWFCTSYQSRMAGCPPKLDDLARMVNPAWRKDARGDMLIRRYSCPPFENDPQGLTQFGVYCDRDVEVMRHLSNFLPQLDEPARKVWAANEVINDRGMPIDTELCELATRYIDTEVTYIEARMIALTGTKARGQALTKWVYDRLTDEQGALMERDGGKLTLDKAARDQLFNLDLAPEVLEALELMDAASLSSTAKFRNMLNRTSPDGRLRGTHVCAGAPATARFASWGVQTHNFPRVSAKDPEEVKKRMKRGQPVTGEELKSMLRPAICAGPGKFIVRCDWSAIEARGLPWLVGTPAAMKYLAAFEDTSRDIYTEQAVVAGLGPMRQEGKVVVLSLGYGGAVGALSTMARAYRVNIPEQPKVVARWREGNPWAPEWWKNLLQAAKRSLTAKKPIAAGKIRFIGPGIMELPSGRRLIYPDMQFDAEGEQLVYLKATKKPKAGAPWPYARLWHGVIAENATQAMCCDLLRELTVREQRSPLIGHIHDECIAEVTNKEEGKKWLRESMLTAPAWARGLPLDAKAEAAKRFGK